MSLNVMFGDMLSFSIYIAQFLCKSFKNFFEIQISCLYLEGK